VPSAPAMRMMMRTTTNTTTTPTTTTTMTVDVSEMNYQAGTTVWSTMVNQNNTHTGAQLTYIVVHVFVITPPPVR
jgi:hypothetical protein